MAEYKVWQPMKYATAKKKEVLDAALIDPNYCIQLKKDGSSYTWTKDLDGSVHLYGDKISKKTGLPIDKIENLPHLKEFAEKYFPNGSQLEVEICYRYDWTKREWLPRSKSSCVNSIMLSDPPKAIQRQKDTEWSQGYVFDILYWNGESVYEQDFGDRWAKIVDIFTNRGMVLDIPDWFRLADTYFENKGEMIADWLAKGEEGGVLKMLRSTRKTSAAHHVREMGATPARPMNTTFKIKQIDTADVVIMGVEMPTSTYTGKDPENHPYKDENGNAVNRLWALGIANSFVIGAYDNGELKRIGTVASGLNDEIREAAANSPNDYIGEVIEIDCMSKDNSAKTFRHARLMRMRPDKAAEHCLLSEIFG